MDKLNTLIAEYLSEKELVWSKSTLASVRSRLKHYKLIPQEAYASLKEQGYNAYYIKISFINFSGLTGWLSDRGFVSSPRVYELWMEKNAQLFRNVYQDKYTDISWEDFEDELRSATMDGGFRTALALLGYAGCRLSELYTFDGGTVLGKGSKRRTVHVPDEFKSGRVSISKDKIRSLLRHNPHDYRKLAADTWLRGGIDLKTVQNLLGHTSIATTQRYMRPMEADLTNSKLNAIWGNK